VDFRSGFGFVCARTVPGCVEGEGVERVVCTVVIGEEREGRNGGGGEEKKSERK